jgi:hypothetical protein
MKRPTRFMVEKASVNGGYLWSRRWGQMRAYPTMIWVQPPGTPTMGHLFLDALPALQKALNFVLESQYSIGGWPQRCPLKNEFSHQGRPDYTSFITFNDDVAGRISGS